MEKEKKVDIVLKGSTKSDDVVFLRPDRLVEVPQHELTDPPLTVPDLEDSIAAMLARRIAGVKTQFNSVNQRNYPVDPNSLTQALDIVKNYNADLQKKLESQDAAITQKIESTKAQKEREKQEKKEFEAFRASQAQMLLNK